MKYSMLLYSRRAILGCLILFFPLALLAQSKRGSKPGKKVTPVQNTDTPPVAPLSLVEMDSLFRAKPSVATAVPLAEKLEEKGAWMQALPVWEVATQKDLQYLPRLWRVQLYTYRLDELEASLNKKYRKLPKAVTEAMNEYKEARSTTRQLVERVQWVEVLDSLSLPTAEAIGLLHTIFPSLRTRSSLSSPNQASERPSALEDLCFVTQRNDRVLYIDSSDPELAQLVDAHLASDGTLETPQTQGWGTSFRHLLAPVLSPDGYTVLLSACSARPGDDYDLCLTRGRDGDEYLQPAPLGFPFNSLFNDYLYAVDEELGLGFLLSDRFAPKGYLTVYVTVARKEYPPVPANDLETLRTYALLSPFQQTQAPDTDYTPYRQRWEQCLARIRTSPSSSVGASMTSSIPPLVIAPEVVYHSEEEFLSPQGRALYQRYIEQERLLIQMEQELAHWREEYHKGSDQQRDELGRKILQAEDYLPHFKAGVAKLLNELRQAEQPYLRRKR